MRRVRIETDAETDAKEIRAEMARLRLLEFRAECRRKEERHARAMRPRVSVPARRRFPWILFLAGLLSWIIAFSFLIP